jgi:hypothetical protein
MQAKHVVPNSSTSLENMLNDEFKSLERDGKKVTQVLFSNGQALILSE